MNYSQTLEYLFSQLPMFHRIGAAAYKADLGNTAALIEMLGHPERNFRSIHVAGTNGKGSVSHLLASVLQEAGLKTGLYTSPHLKDFRERIRINGKMVPKDYVTRFVSLNKASFEKINPSFFEYTAVMAFEYFSDQQVDIAVMETGMGGRLDSTNVIFPLVSVITNISLDHTAFLGMTPQQIAGEKAGIIKPGIPVIIGENDPETAGVFLAKASENHAKIVFADKHYSASKKKAGKNPQGRITWNIDRDGKSFLQGLKCPLKGNYQSRNLPTVMAVIEVLQQSGYKITDKEIRIGLERVLKNTKLQGRWQILGRKPLIICDVGHNEAGINWLTRQIREEKFRQLHWVFGMVNDKDSEKILRLLPPSAQYYFCKADIPRGKDARELQSEALLFGLKGDVYSSVREAYEAARSAASENDLIFIGGSTFVVAEVL